MLPLDIWLDNRKQGDSEMLDEDYPILLSIQQAARKIGKSEKTIRRWIKDGKLKAENRGGGYLIKREDLEAVTKHVTTSTLMRLDTYVQYRLEFPLLSS